MNGFQHGLGAIELTKLDGTRREISIAPLQEAVDVLGEPRTGEIRGLEIGTTLTPETRGLPSATLVTVHQFAGLPDRHIQQVLDALPGLAKDRPIEIGMHPEELGKLRMTLHPSDGIMALSISAERPETLDLLRRHIDLLTTQLRDLGYAKLDLSFEGEGRPDKWAGPNRHGEGTHDDEPAITTGTAPSRRPARLIAAGQLDLRL